MWLIKWFNEQLQIAGNSTCFTTSHDECKFPYNLTENAIYYGCFWNPTRKQFGCPTKFNSDINDRSPICEEDCPKDCGQYLWKCHNSCIPIGSPCGTECFPGNEMFVYILEEVFVDDRTLFHPLWVHDRGSYCILYYIRLVSKHNTCVPV